MNNKLLAIMFSVILTAGVLFLATDSGEDLVKRIALDRESYQAWQEKVIVMDIEGIELLRGTDITREEREEYFLSYNSLQKGLIIENATHELIDARLITPYHNIISGGGLNTKVIEFYLEDSDVSVKKLFDSWVLYDLNNDYKIVEKELTFKYGVDEIIEKCIDNGKECYSGIETIWTEITDLSKIPKPSKIGIFTDTELGEKIEFVPTKKGITINQWAEWEIATATFVNNNSIGGITPLGLAWSTNGSIMYTLDNTPDMVNQFKCTTAWNPTTCSNTTSFVSTTPALNGRGLFWRDDGTNFYLVNQNVDAMHQFNCTVAWESTSCVHDSSMTISTQDSNPEDIEWRSDNGLRLYEVGRTTIYEYDCGTAWVLSTCAFNTNTITPQDATTEDIQFRPNGLLMLEIGLGADLIYQNTCSSAWDLTSCTYDNINLTLQGDTDFSMFMSSDGVHLFEAGVGGVWHWQTVIITFPTITLDQPVDEENFTLTNNIVFNATIFDDTNISNVTLYFDNIINETNLTAGINNSVWTFTKNMPDGSTDWLFQACDPENNCINSSGRTVNVDVNSPAVVITTPSVNVLFQEVDVNLSINWTITEPNLDTCILEYKSVNRTVTCIDNSTQVNISRIEDTSATFHVNDTFGNNNVTFISWAYSIFQTAVDFNATTAETKTESFIINFTTNGSNPTNGRLFYGTESSGIATITNITVNNFTITRAIDIPLDETSNLWGFNITLGSDDISTNLRNQTVNDTTLALCDATFTIPFLNITFRDEQDLAILNASIPASQFEYYLGTGSVNQTLSFVETDLNFNYTFCSNAQDTLSVQPFLQYKQGVLYPQRIWNPTLREYNATMTTQVLDLLSSTEGIFVTFQVINKAEQPISGVDVNGTRNVGGVQSQVAAGTTSAAGSVTFWLNPDFSHDFIFQKSGFETFLTTLFPNQPIFTITLGESTTVLPDLTGGITYTIRPAGDFLANNSVHTFNYTLASSTFNIEQFGFTLSYSNGTEIGTVSATTQGGTVSLSANVSNVSRIIMSYNYLIDSTFSNGTRVWTIEFGIGEQFSILRFFTDLVLYIDADLFGFDDFGKALLSFVILIMTTGLLSRRYGLNSDAAIMGIVFGVVLFLDVGIGLIPNPSFGGLGGIDNFLTVLVGIMLAGFIIREETR